MPPKCPAGSTRTRSQPSSLGRVCQGVDPPCFISRSSEPGTGPGMEAQGLRKGLLINRLTGYPNVDLSFQTVSRTVSHPLSGLTLTAILWSADVIESCCIDDDTEEQRGVVTCSRSHSVSMVKPGFTPRLWYPLDHWGQAHSTVPSPCHDQCQALETQVT